jgi:hypothetical protein
MFNGFKMSNFRYRSYVEINLAKKHVWLSIETHFGFFYVLVINQNIDTQLCIHVKNHHCHIIISNWTIRFFSLKFVPSKCYLQKVALQKS